MKIQISRRFQKDCSRIQDQRILAKIRQTLEAAQQAESVSELTQIVEMKGYSGYYRFKFDYRYRMGVYLDGNTLQFLRVSRREDFYKKFP